MLLVGSSLITCLNSNAQNLISSNRNDTTKSYKKKELPDSIIEKRLLTLALTNPAFDAAKHNNKINEYQLKAAKNAWLNLLTLSANYNDQTFSNTSSTGQVVYPKYFTGITIPLGSIFSKTSIKAAKEQVEIGKLNEELISRNIRAEVIGKYIQFKTYEILIYHQQQVVDDYKAGLLQAEKKFSNQEITIEYYNNSSKNYNDELAKLLNLKLQQQILELEIEKIIGTDLETILFEPE